MHNIEQKGLFMTIKRSLGMISAIAGVAVLVGCLQKSEPKTKAPDMVNTYVGVYREFRVEIVDTNYSGDESWEVFIKLSPTSKDRDYDQILVNANRTKGKLEFKKVFYCGYPDRTNGCGGMELLGGNKFKIITDENRGTITPITTEMYFFAVKKAEEVFSEMHNEQHLVSSEVNRLGNVVK